MSDNPLAALYGRMTAGPWEADMMLDFQDPDPEVLDPEGFPVVEVKSSPIINRWDERFPDMGHWADGADAGLTLHHRGDEEARANAAGIVAAHRLLSAVAEPAELRERMARVIDPEAWAERDRRFGRVRERAKTAPTAEHREVAVSYAFIDAAEELRASLTKADALITLLQSLALGEGE